MKRALSRVCCVLLSAIMIISLVGFTSSTAKNSTSVDSSWSKFKGVTLTYWHPFSSTYIKSLDDNLVMQQMQKITGIKIQFVTPAVGEEQEAFNLMIASGDYPDIMNVRDYKGGGLQAVKDGVYLKLNDVIKKYAPNYSAVLASNPDIARQAKEDDGTIWSFKCFQIDDEPSWAGPAIRQDYLDELGLKMPKTIDDWHTVLTAFKTKKKIIPMMLPINRFYAAEIFAGTYGASTTQFLNKKGTVVYGPIEPGYKKFLTLMNQWYKEGLIDPDFATRDDKSLDAQITSGKAGSCATTFYGSFGAYQVAGTATNPKFEYVAAPYPVINKGDDVSKALHIGNKNWNSKGCDLAINPKCKNVEAAVRWIDYRYSDEGFMLFNYGIQGVSYNWVKGALDKKNGPAFFPKGLQAKIKTQHPEFTKVLTNNPDGVDFGTAKDKYKGLYVAQLRNPLADKFTPEIYSAMDIWSKPGKDYMMPPLSATEKEAQVEADVINQINTYRDEMTLKFIMGAEPISNFDKYVTQIKALGINKLIKVRQDQLNRYLHR